jgi:hypothetical protein
MRRIGACVTLWVLRRVIIAVRALGGARTTRSGEPQLFAMIAVGSASSTGRGRLAGERGRKRLRTGAVEPRSSRTLSFPCARARGGGQSRVGGMMAQCSTVCVSICLDASSPQRIMARLLRLVLCRPKTHRSIKKKKYIKKGLTGAVPRQSHFMGREDMTENCSISRGSEA